MIKPDDLKNCPVCGSHKIDIDGSMFSEFYGHEYVDSEICCSECGFEVRIPTGSKRFPCSCHHGKEMDAECIRMWQSIPRGENQ